MEFDPHGVFTAEIGLPAIKYPVRADADRFWSALTERVRSIPGVQTAAGTTLLPLRGGGDTYFYVDGRPPATDADKLNATVSVVTDDYLETMRIPVRSGRAFTGTDRADGRGVLLINEGLARRHSYCRQQFARRLDVCGSGRTKHSAVRSRKSSGVYLTFMYHALPCRLGGPRQCVSY